MKGCHPSCLAQCVWHQLGTKLLTLGGTFPIHLLLGRRLQSSVFADFLVGQRFHEAFLVPKQRECCHIHTLQTYQNFLSLSRGKNVFYHYVLRAPAGDRSRSDGFHRNRLPGQRLCRWYIRTVEHSGACG